MHAVYVGVILYLDRLQKIEEKIAQIKKGKYKMNPVLPGVRRINAFFHIKVKKRTDKQIEPFGRVCDDQDMSDISCNIKPLFKDG